MKDIKNILVAIGIASMLIACGGGGSGGSGNGETSHGGVVDGASISYVSGDYQIKGTSVTTIENRPSQTLEFSDTISYKLQNNTLKGGLLGEDFASLFSSTTSDSGEIYTLYSDGSFKGTRTIEGFDKTRPYIRVRLTIHENGSFGKNSVSGNLLGNLTFTSASQTKTGTLKTSYYSTGKTPHYTQQTTQPNPPTTQTNNVERDLKNECQNINGTLVPFIADNSHSYTCSFGNNRPSSYANFKNSCEKHGFTFKDSSISFMCFGELDNTATNDNSSGYLYSSEANKRYAKAEGSYAVSVSSTATSDITQETIHLDFNDTITFTATKSYKFTGGGSEAMLNALKKQGFIVTSDSGGYLVFDKALSSGNYRFNGSRQIKGTLMGNNISISITETGKFTRKFLQVRGVEGEYKAVSTSNVGGYSATSTTIGKYKGRKNK